jgi:hypothetical protein
LSATVLLMALLALSAAGSFLVAGRGRGNGVGLASGLEFVALGLLVGPHALGLVDRAIIDQFEPMVQVALAWFTFTVGLDLGFVGYARAPLRVMACGAASALLTGVLVFLAVYPLARFLKLGDAQVCVFLAGGVGAACAETTRQVVRWAEARHRAKGELTAILSGFGSSDDVAPILAAALVFALNARDSATLALPWWGALLMTLALGALLGVVGVLLVRNTEGYAVWSALFGTVLLGAGIAARFGLLSIAVTFVMGIALGFSPHRRALRTLVRPTERAVILPALLVAGMRLDPHVIMERQTLWVVIGAAIAARFASKLVAGLLVHHLSLAARNTGRALGLSLVSSGALSLTVGLAFALRAPGVVGDTVLVAAVACALVGELIGPRHLHRALCLAGDIETAGAQPPGPLANGARP